MTGDWGSGKTFQVKNLVAGKQSHYVSLFGLTSKEDVYGELLAQLYPPDARAKKEANFLDKLNILGIPVGIVLAEVVRNSLQTKIQKNSVIVFDDVERTIIPLKVILGLINDLVEHEQCRVLVIAHDGKIAEEFAGAKEKVFGHTIAVVPRTAEAFGSFALELKQNTQKILADHRETLLDLFLISNCQSLRVLRQALMGVERFCELFDIEQISNSAVMKKLLSLYFAVSIEVLRGQLDREDLVDRIRSYTLAKAWRERKTTANPIGQPERQNAFSISHARYVSKLEISNFDLGNELLVQMIVEGHYNKAKLQNYLIESQTFEPVENWPAWRTFLNFDELPDSVVELAAREMDRQFLDREITELGELMHVVSLKIMRIDEGLESGSREDVLDQCLTYLDDLVTKQKFPLAVNYSIFGTHPAHGGSMFWGYEKNADIIQKISQHAVQCEKLALKSLAPEICKKVYAALRKSPDDLASLLNYSENKSSEYQTIPVMTCLSVEEFVDELLSLPLIHWRATQIVLIKRREMSSVRNSLAEEARWFEELEAEIERRSIEQAGTINGLRMKRHVPRK